MKMLEDVSTSALKVKAVVPPKCFTCLPDYTATHPRFVMLVVTVRMGNIHFIIQDTPPLDSQLSQLNPVHILVQHFFNVQFTLIQVSQNVDHFLAKYCVCCLY